eukprot:3119268-Alexandrium_andersonii.AAC.1
MLDEQLEVIEERVRETGNAEVLNEAATALAQLFGAAKNRWGAVAKADRLYVEQIVATFDMDYSRLEKELATAGGPVNAGVASASAAPDAPAVAQMPEKIEKVLARCREEVHQDRQSNVLLAAHDTAREYFSHSGKSSQETGASWEDYLNCEWDGDS